MRPGLSRNLYEFIFWGIVVALLYINRGLYDSIKLAIEPMVQAYTQVVMFIFGLTLFFFLNYLKEAIAGIYVAFFQRVSSGGTLNLDKGDISKNLHSVARKMEKKGNFLAAGETYETLEAWTDAGRVYEKGHAWNRAASAYEKAKNFEKAIELYERDGSFIAAGTLAKKLGFLERTKKNLRMAAEEAIGANQHVSAGELLESAGDYQQAAEIFFTAHRTEHALRCFEKAGNSEKVLEIVREVLESKAGRRGDSTNEIYMRSAELLVTHGHYDEAARMMDLIGETIRAAEIYEIGKLWDKASDIYLKCEEPEKAEQTYNKIPLEDQDPEFRARIAIAKNDLQGAGEFYEQAGKLNQAIDSYKRVKNYDAAARLYIQMGRYIMAGEMYSTSRNFKEAADCYAKAYDWRNAAECYEAINEVGLAMEAYASAGNFHKAGKMALQLQDHEKAASFFQQVQPTSNDYHEALSHLGTISFGQKRYDIALDYFRNSIGKIRFAAENLEVFYAYAGALEKVNTAEAAAVYRRITGIDPTYKDALERLSELEDKSRGPEAHPIPVPTAEVVNAETGIASFAGLSSAGTLVNESEVKSTIGTAFNPTTVNNISPNTTLENRETLDNSASLIGTYIDEENRYYIVENLGKVGIVSFYKAKDSVHNTFVMVQVTPLADTNMDFPNASARLKRIAGIPPSGYLCTTHNTGIYENRVYIVSDLPGGSSLYKAVRSNGPFSVDEIKIAMRSICNGIDHIHRYGLSHGALSPHTIFVENLRDYKIRGIGFDLSGASEGETLLDGEWLDMQVDYMAPEQILGNGVYPASDIYNLGLILFFMAIGQSIFDVKRISGNKDIAKFQVHNALPRPSSIRAMLPTELDDIFVKSTQKSIGARYKSVVELMDDLEKI